MLVLALIATVYADEAPLAESPPAEPPQRLAYVRSAVWVSPDVARIPSLGGWSFAASPLHPSTEPTSSSFEPEAGRHGALDVSGASLWGLGRPLVVLPGRRLGPVPGMVEVMWRGAPGVTLPGSDRPWWVR